MTTTVNTQEAKTQLSALLARVERGERITLARRGKPIAQLVPLEEPKVQFDFWPGEVSDEAVAPLDDEELALWGVL